MPLGPDSTRVRHTYDWTEIDKRLREKLPFPVVSEKRLADTLGYLAAAVAG